MSATWLVSCRTCDHWMGWGSERRYITCCKRLGDQQRHTQVYPRLSLVSSEVQLASRRDPAAGIHLSFQNLAWTPLLTRHTRFCFRGFQFLHIPCQRLEPGREGSKRGIREFPHLYLAFITRDPKRIRGIADVQPNTHHESIINVSCVPQPEAPHQLSIGKSCLKRGGACGVDRSCHPTERSDKPYPPHHKTDLGSWFDCIT